MVVCMSPLRAKSCPNPNTPRACERHAAPYEDAPYCPASPLHYQLALYNSLMLFIYSVSVCL